MDMVARVNLTERNLSGAVVAELAQVSAATLRQWRSRGFIPAASTPNAWPTFSLLEALKIALIAEISRYAIELWQAAQIVEALDEIKTVEEITAPLFLVADHYVKLPTEGELRIELAQSEKRAKSKKPRRGRHARSKVSRPVEAETLDDEFANAKWEPVYLADLSRERSFSLSDDPEATALIVVDVAKVFRRIEKRLETLRKEG